MGTVVLPPDPKMDLGGHIVVPAAQAIPRGWSLICHSFHFPPQTKTPKPKKSAKKKKQEEEVLGGLPQFISLQGSLQAVGGAIVRLFGLESLPFHYGHMSFRTRLGN